MAISVARFGQALAGADVEGHARPAPVVDRRARRRRTSRSRTAGRRPAPRGSPGPCVAATQPGPYWPRTTSVTTSPGSHGDRAQDLDLLVAQRIGLEGGRRLHRDEAEQLQQVVLEDVARRAGLLVERAAVLDADRLGHRDLHVVDVAAVPERLEDAVAEPEDQQVADGLLAQVVVDAVDLRLAEDLADLAVEPLRRVEVVAERLLDDDPPPAAVVALVVEPDPAELGDDLGELRRLGREVEEPVAAGAALRRRARRGASARASKPSASAKSQPVVADPLARTSARRPRRAAGRG